MNLCICSLVVFGLSCGGLVDSEAIVPKTQEFMFVPSNRDFYIAILLPIHQRDQSFFGCGPANNTNILYDLNAILNALNITNEALLLRTGISLGLLVLDYCDRSVRAIDQLYRLLSNDTSSFPIKSTSVIGVITVDRTVTQGIHPITTPTQLVHLFSPIRPETVDSGETRPSVLPVSISMTEWFRALADFLRAANIQLMSVIYSDNDFGIEGVKLLGKFAPTVCVISSVPVGHVRDLLNSARRLVNVRGQVTLVLVDDPDMIQTFLKSNRSSDGIYIVNDAMLPSGVVTNTNVNIISIGLGFWSPPEGLSSYLISVTPINSLIFNSWITELWENYFSCSLRNETIFKYPKCKGTEHLKSEKAKNPSLHQLSTAIEALSVGFGNFLTRHCPKYDSAQNILSCGSEARNLYLRETQTALLGDSERGQKPLMANAEGTSDLLVTYYARQLYGEAIIPNKLGIWRNHFIPLINSLSAAFRRYSPSEVPCIGMCARSCPGQAASLVPAPIDPSTNFRSVWGIVTSTFSGLGMLGVIACFAYFVIVVPSTKGTALLDYVILTGLFLEYGINFAFIASTTDALCVLRRFLMGVAYAIVFSAKLVKVVNSWRVARNYNPRSSVASSTRCNQWEVNPAFALLISLSLSAFQVGVAIAWLILSPSRTIYHKNIIICGPGENFEEGLILSFLYVMVLMLLVLCFSFLTRKVESYNQESKWIFLATSLNVLLWLIWTVVATLGEVEERGTAVVVGNLLCATITLTCVFLPKIYLYGTLLRQAKKLDIRAFYPQSKRRQQAVTCLYDPLQYGSVTSSYASMNDGSYGRAIPVAEHQQKRVGTKGGKDKVQSQVISVDSTKYPRLKYDNRSQFQVENNFIMPNGTTERNGKHNGFSSMNRPSPRNKLEHF